MQFNSLEELYDYLATYVETEIVDDTYPENPVPFDYNKDALNVLFHNAINTKDLGVAFRVLEYANDHSISLIKGL